MVALDPGPKNAQTPTTTSPVVALAVAAKAGKTAAFEQLVDLYQDRIFRMAYYRTRSRMDAEALTQEIFIQAFKNLSKVRVPDQFGTWLFSIAVNRVRDFQRKKRLLSLFRNSSHQLDDFDESNAGAVSNSDALDHLIRQDFWKQIDLLMRKLSYLEREVFILRFMDQLHIMEIAQVLHKSESTVKTHLYRAIKKFKQERTLLQLLEEVTL